MSGQPTGSDHRQSLPPPTYTESCGDAVLDPSTSAGGVPSNVPSATDTPIAAAPSRVGSFLSRSFGSTRQPETSTSSRPPVPTPQPEVVLTWQPPPGSRPLATGPIKYTFSPVGAHSMVLVPLEANWDTVPLYHVSWRDDYFRPESIVTTIRKGANEDAPFLAEFSSDVVRVGSTEHWLHEKLVEKPTKHWKWTNDGIQLRWTQDTDPLWFKCMQLVNDDYRQTLAFFKPPNYRALSRRCELTIYPEGQGKFDDILLCGLMLEQKYLTRYS